MAVSKKSKRALTHHSKAHAAAGDDAGDKEGGGDNGANADLEGPKKIVMIPPEQLSLTPDQLNEDITKLLYANDPNAPSNLSRFSFKDRCYKIEPMVDQLAIHYSTDGWLRNVAPKEAEDGDDAEDSGGGGGGGGIVPLAPSSADAKKDDSVVKLRNQFNYSDRSTQANVQPKKDGGTVTDPPPVLSFSAGVNAWTIYDSYIADQKSQQIAKDLAKGQRGPRGKDSGDAQKPAKPPAVETAKREISVIHSEAMEMCTKVLERMTILNIYDDIAKDFKYWNDPSDACKDGEGTVLPLWKFQHDRVAKKAVTSICWNAQFKDLFAVGYGSFDFMKQGRGMICCFSLKNPSHPECMFSTPCGVMSINFHPEHSNLLAAGLYDGSVMAFDVRSKSQTPIFKSTVKNGKHTDPVWQVCWQEDDMNRNLSFFSVSSDGRVSLWTMNKSEMSYQNVIELRLNEVDKAVEDDSLKSAPGSDDEPAIGLQAGACSFALNSFTGHLFIVGTEEGTIYKCSKAYSSRSLETYDGHHMGVYAVAWNKFHPRIFLSGSADWTVKMWDHNSTRPILSLDLNSTVGDVAWAPHSSTIFAATTADGKVFVFDLNESRHEPICEQKVVAKAKLTKICFNPVLPVILVGDDRGCVHSLKLSPNLRKQVGPPPEGSEKTREDMEIEKLDKIIAVALKSDGP